MFRRFAVGKFNIICATLAESFPVFRRALAFGSRAFRSLRNPALLKFLRHNYIFPGQNANFRAFFYEQIFVTTTEARAKELNSGRTRRTLAPHSTKVFLIDIPILFGSPNGLLKLNLNFAGAGQGGLIANSISKR